MQVCNKSLLILTKLHDQTSSHFLTSFTCFNSVLGYPQRETFSLDLVLVASFSLSLHFDLKQSMTKNITDDVTEIAKEKTCILEMPQNSVRL